MGRANTRPTVTDANVVLGRIDPDSPIGGTLDRLDVQAAAEAIDAHVGAKLGLTTTEAAEAILRVANSRMAGAIPAGQHRAWVRPQALCLHAVWRWRCVAHRRHTERGGNRSRDCAPLPGRHKCHGLCDCRHAAGFRSNHQRTDNGLGCWRAGRSDAAACGRWARASGRRSVAFRRSGNGFRVRHGLCGADPHGFGPGRGRGAPETVFRRSPFPTSRRRSMLPITGPTAGF